MDNTSGHYKPWYRNLAKPPCQRQKWGEDQVLPHVNWGDLFFDLFYVAAAYNLSYIIKSDPSLLSVLYVTGCLFPLFFNFWSMKLVFDARFQTLDDVFHLFLEVLKLTCLGTAVLHIRPVKDMSNASDHVEMFAFCLANLLGLIVWVVRIIETGIWGVGQAELLRYVAVSDLLMLIPNFMLMIPATIYSGVLYFRHSDGDGYGGDDNYNRLLTDAGYSRSESRSISHIPIILCFSLIFIRTPIQYMIMLIRGKGDFKKVSIPMNVDFAIHRYGEWVMLMLGESILSLLIVEISDKPEFYFTFYVGVISVVLLQFLHFKSQPHHADDHAMRQSRERGLSLMIVVLWYSAALIIVGVCYKMLLTEYSKKDDDYESNGRFLAGDGGVSSYTQSERRTRIANLFGGSMAVIFASLDLMTLLHNGFRVSMKRCVCEEKGVRYKGIALVVLSRIGIITAVAMVSYYVNSPGYVALVGLVAIVAQITIRLIGSTFFPRISEHHAHENVLENAHKDEKEEAWLGE